MNERKEKRTKKETTIIRRIRRLPLMWGDADVILETMRGLLVNSI